MTPAVQTRREPRHVDLRLSLGEEMILGAALKCLNTHAVIPVGRVREVDAFRALAYAEGASMVEAAKPLGDPCWDPRHKELMIVLYDELTATIEERIEAAA